MRIKELIKNNLLGFVIGAIVFSSIGIVAATTLGPSDYWFETTKNSNVENVEDALDDLYTLVPDFPITCYNGICGKLSYRYWNNNFTYQNFSCNQLPTNNYATRALLEQNYGSSNFTDNPMYIRSVLIDGVVVGHQSCLWNNNKEYCMENKYWAGILNTSSENAETQTKLKLQRDMQDALGVTIQDSSCDSGAGVASCNVGDFFCAAFSGGDVGCGSDVTVVSCDVYDDGSADCE